MDDPPLFRLILLGIFLLLSGIFSGSETALTALSKIKIKSLQERFGEEAKILSLWLHHPQRLLTTILVGNNFVNIAASAIATSIAINFAQNRGIPNSNAVGLATGVMTFVILVFGEIVPKTFAHANSEKIAPKAIKFIHVLSLVLFPVVKFLSWISLGITRLFGGKSVKFEPLLAFEEIKSVISVGEREGVLEEEEKEMIEGIFEIGETRVSEIMVPRIDMFTIELKISLSEAVRQIKERGYSRVPVFNKRMDNIVGVLYAKDLLKIWEEEETNKIKLKDLIRKPYFVPESKKLNDLLREFRREKTHIAIVVDEYGGTAGLVTIEDVLEEIVGEIEDEYDRGKKLWKKLGSRTFLMDAKLEIDKANEELNLNIPEDDFESVGGFVIDFLGRVPQKGEVFTFEDKRIEIIDADERRIKQLKIAIIETDQQNKED